MAIQPIDEDRLERAVALIEEGCRPLAILLFGSHASGRQERDSDVDLGVFLGRSAADPFVVAKLRTDLEDVLGRIVDLVVLDDASPVLRMEVLRQHRVLINRDPESFERFVVQTLGEYFDLKRAREPIERALFVERR